MAILCNNQELPLNIIVKIGNESYKMTHFDSWPPKLEGQENGFMIIENLSLCISLIPEDESNYDENCYLEIVTQEENSLEPTSCKIKIGTTVDIFSYSRDVIVSFPFRLGYTPMRLFYQGKIYETLVEVIPIHYNKAQVTAIHNYLENQIKHICYDLIKSNSLGNQFNEHITKWYQEYGRFHQEHESEIISTLYQVQQDQLKNIEKRYKPQPYQRQIDAKSIRKSLIKATSQFGATQYFNKKAVLVLDKKQSIWVKSTIYRWKFRLEEAIEAISKELDHILFEQKKIKNTIDLVQERTRLINNVNVSKIYTNSIHTDSKVAAKRLKELEYHQQVRIQWLKSLNLIKQQVMFLLLETELKDIPLRPPKGQLWIKGPILKRLKRLYEESESIARPGGRNKHSTLALKPTHTIFEYFVVSKVIEILASLSYNFKITQGMDESIAENIIKNGIPEGACFTLENDTHLIKVTYDDTIPRSEEDAERLGHHFFTISNHNRPDLRIELYEKINEKIGCCLGIIVLEVKYRKFDVLYNSPPTETMVQLNDYATIKCRQPKEFECPEKHHYVDKVICCYSGRNNGNNLEYKSGSFYIRLFPNISETGEIQELFGESELTSQFHNWLKGYITQ